MVTTDYGATSLPIKSGRKKLPPQLKRTVRKELSFTAAEYTGWLALMEVTGLSFRKLISTMYKEKCNELIEPLLALHYRAIHASAKEVSNA